MQIVSSMLHLQAAHVQNADANTALQAASARVHAIAAVHERLYTGKDIRVVSLDVFLASLCANIGDAMGGSEPVQVDLASVEVPTDMAIPLALAVNELLTNALKYGRPPYRVILKAQGEHLILTVSDAGLGPATQQKSTGLGSKIIETVATQLVAAVETTRRPDGYVVELVIPRQVATKFVDS